MSREPLVRRLLGHFCSPDTLRRVVDPVLADIRFEAGRPAWLGYLALMRALAVQVVVSIPGAIAHICADDERAIARAAAAGAVTTAIVAAPLMALPAIGNPPLNAWRAIVFLAPQALVLALPASLLLAIPYALSRAAVSRRLITRAVLISALCGGCTFILVTYVMPEANQAFRVDTGAYFNQGPPARGPNEMTLRQLREQIEALNVRPADPRVVRAFEYTYQLKFALSAIALPIGAVAITIARSRRCRARPILVGAGAVLAYMALIFGIDGAAGRLIARDLGIAPAVFAWCPTLAMIAIATVLIHQSRRRMVRTCP